MYEFTVAHVGWEGDGMMALYDGDKMVFSGDDYHDKIHESIDSFINGVEYTGVEVVRQDVYVSDNHVEEWDYDCPDSLEELKKKWPEWSYDCE